MAIIVKDRHRKAVEMKIIGMILTRRRIRSIEFKSKSSPNPFNIITLSMIDDKLANTESICILSKK